MRNVTLGLRFDVSTLVRIPRFLALQKVSTLLGKYLILHLNVEPDFLSLSNYIVFYVC